MEGWAGVGNALPEGSTLAATVLSRAGCEVKGYDLRGFSGSEESILDEVEEDDLVCLSGTPEGYVFVRRFAAALKERNRSRPILLGGCLSTVSWKTVLARTAVDFCLLGECEAVLPQFVRLLESDEPPCNLPVAYKSDGTIHDVALESICPAPDEIPIPDLRIWSVSCTSGQTQTMCYSTQRGCRYSCTFCVNPWEGRWRPLPTPQIREALSQLKARGMREVWFNDPTFNTDEGHCWQVIRVMRDLGLPWTCTIRATPASRELLAGMRDAGCQTVFLGIESADDAVLAGNNKAIDVRDTERCLAATQSVGLPVVGFVMLGLPGETSESLAKTVAFARKHSFIPRAHFAMPYPGSALFQAFWKQHPDRFSTAGAAEEHLLEVMSGASYDEVKPLFRISEIGVSAKDLSDTMADLAAISRERQFARGRL
ncbi:MAG: radical SAM protein [Phycisphaerae bacterium]